MFLFLHVSLKNRADFLATIYFDLSFKIYTIMKCHVHNYAVVSGVIVLCSFALNKVVEKSNIIVTHDMLYLRDGIQISY